MNQFFHNVFEYNMKIEQSGIRTHAVCILPDLKSGSLNRSDICPQTNILEPLYIYLLHIDLLTSN